MYLMYIILSQYDTERCYKGGKVIFKSPFIENMLSLAVTYVCAPPPPELEFLAFLHMCRRQKGLHFEFFFSP